MNPVIKYLFLALVFIIGLFLLWFFRSIFLFIAISAVLSLVNRPLADLFKRIKFRNRPMGNGWAALFTVLIIWLVIIVIFRFTIPLVVNELQFLSTVDIPSVIDRVGQKLFDALEPLREKNGDLVVLIEKQVEEVHLRCLISVRLKWFFPL